MRLPLAFVVLALEVLDVAAASSGAHTEDMRLIRWSSDAGSTAYIPMAAISYLSSKGVRIDPTSPILQGVPQAFVDHMARRPARSRGPGYLDLTEVGLRESESKLEKRQTIFPSPAPALHPEISAMFPAISASGLKSTVVTLSTNFSTRYYKSANARAPALWIQSQFVAAAGASNVKLVENTFDQPNVIASIPRKVGSTNDEIVIIGAHLDSISRSASTLAPGADDDASGISILIQALQILKSNGWAGTRAVEFHAYAGEEPGMLGSGVVASQYKAAGKSVRAMLQMDMVAYQNSYKPVITILTDLGADLVNYSKQLISGYIPEASLILNKCGYACSDHYSWDNNGYPAISIDESGPNDSLLNPYYHTLNDTVDKLNFEKASVFVKLALSFAVELSG